MINATSATLARVMGLEMVRGRWIGDNEPTAVINEHLARREFPEQDAIGRRIRLDEGERWLTIVGVAADLRYSRLDEPPEPELYVPYSHVDGMFSFTALVRTTGDPLALAPTIRPLIDRIDKMQVADDVMTLERALAETIAPRRGSLFLLATFATSALVLALIGLYGLMTFGSANGDRKSVCGWRSARAAKKWSAWLCARGWAWPWPALGLGLSERLH